MKDAFLASIFVHSHMCGPTKPLSMGGYNYFHTFIDEFKIKSRVYFLKDKSDAFSSFQKFKALVENQSGYTIKILRTDRGSEYVLNEFLNFCKTHGIQKQFTTQYTPQHNGVAERKKLTIMEMACNMIATKQ